MEALCLINVVATQAGWIEWGYQKINARYLKSKGMTQGVLDYLMWHHFGRVGNHLFKWHDVICGNISFNINHFIHFCQKHILE